MSSNAAADCPVTSSRHAFTYAAAARETLEASGPWTLVAKARDQAYETSVDERYGPETSAARVRDRACWRGNHPSPFARALGVSAFDFGRY